MQARALLVLVVCLAAVAPAAAGSVSDDTIDRRLTVSLTPDDPGAVRVHATFDVPETLTSLTAILPADATVVSMDGFTQRSDTQYEWQKTVTRPSLTYRLPVNRTAGEDRAGTDAGDVAYSFVDVGEWALVATPRIPVRYAGFGEPPEVTKTVVVEGSGVSGTAMTYLGPYDERTRQVGDQTVRLVVPAAADVSAGEPTILDTLTASARSFTLGTPDDEVVAFAAPTTVQWGTPGLQRGPAEFWVRDSQPVTTPNNIWIHEYVHTRQNTATADSSRWLVEGGAEYYASLLTLQQGRTDFESFRRHLGFGTRSRYADAVLANRSDWEGTGANYWKGALVAAAIDRQIRLATDRERTLLDVYDRGDDDGFTNEEFLDAVGDVAGADAREYARTHTTTEAVPALWNESQHAVAFGDAAATTTEVVGVEVRGPYRNATVDSPATVVPGERVRLRVRMTNTGQVPGEFSVPLVADDDVVDRRTGRLDPGETTTVSFERDYAATGEHTLAVGARTVAVQVRDPASPTVADVDVPATVVPGEAFTVRATVRNDADRPADGPVPVTVDGEAVAAPGVRLPPGASTTVEIPVAVERGTRTLAVGNVTATVTAGRSDGAASTTRSTTAADETTSAGGAGFGALAALVALGAVLLRRR